jgi:LPPG:FO 2-phospho-L-lactate transferase
MKIVVFSGGVGGAKLVDGLSQLLRPGNLTIVVNTGDDFEHFGLYICPDLDTVCYTLAGLANSKTGWGRNDEKFIAMENIKRLGGPDWFSIGDKDMATHLERSRRLKKGQLLSQITREFCQAWGIKHLILPMSNQPVRTMVDTIGYGELAFQEYFVQQNYEPKVKGIRFAGVELASPAPGVTDAINEADAIIFGPSNPWISIDPILAISDIRSSMNGKTVVAVSPIIGGKTVKGPAAKIFSEMGIAPSALAISQHYKHLLSGLILDSVDADTAKEFSIPVKITNTIMRTQEDRRHLAEDVLNLIQNLIIS